MIKSMSLDEAIQHCKEIADDEKTCEKCREEHKQLAEWLDELKELRRVPKEMNTFQGVEDYSY